MPTACSFYRRSGEEHYGEDERRRLALLVPHFSRALGVMTRLRLNDLKVASSLSALDQLPIAVLLMSACGDVLFANRAATRNAARHRRAAARPIGRRPAASASSSPSGAGSTATSRRAVHRQGLDDVVHFSSVIKVPGSVPEQDKLIQLSGVGLGRRSAPTASCPRSSPSSPIRAAAGGGAGAAVEKIRPDGGGSAGGRRRDRRRVARGDRRDADAEHQHGRRASCSRSMPRPASAAGPSSSGSCWDSPPPADDQHLQEARSSVSPACRATNVAGVAGALDAVDPHPGRPGQGPRRRRRREASRAAPEVDLDHATARIALHASAPAERTVGRAQALSASPRPSNHAIGMPAARTSDRVARARRRTGRAPSGCDRRDPAVRHVADEARLARRRAPLPRPTGSSRLAGGRGRRSRAACGARSRWPSRTKAPTLRHS